MEDNKIELLKNVEGLSVSEGLEYCGCEAAFIKFINTFYNSIKKRASELEEAFENEDYALYGMKAHSLKSTSRFIGATELSSFALKMEEAGEKGDISFIKENHERFLTFYKSYLEKLSVLDEDNIDDAGGKDKAGDLRIDVAEEREVVKGGDSKKNISAEELKDAYRSLTDSVEMMDYDAVEFILLEIKKYDIPPEHRKNFVGLEKLLGTMDWDEMKKLCDSFVI